MHTCYSPVRQSPAESASTLPVALRLACVKPAASVHPEPGSNSSLYKFLIFLSLNLTLSISVPHLAGRNRRFSFLSCSRYLLSCTSSSLLNELLIAILSNGSAKVSLFS